ncbi:MAG TPA: kelch repeat-containing protein [Terriglobia bacterium]
MPDQAIRGKSAPVSFVWVAVLVCIFLPLQCAQAQMWDFYGPPTRYGHSAVYNSDSDIMVVFGGQHTNTSLNYNDIWWANNVVKAACLPPCALQWTRPSPALKGSPSARFWHTAVYDSAENRMVVFGGAQGVASPPPCLNDAYVLEYATGIGGTTQWIKLITTGGPPAARYGHTAVYDPSNNVMIVFGGNDCSSTYLNDVWVLSNANGLDGTPTWSQIFPSGPAPPARAFTSAVYDATNNRMIVFGGFNGSYLGDLWVLTNANGIGGTPAWLESTPSGAPSPRSGHSAVYDASLDRMIVFGGETGEGNVAETWVLADANGLRGIPSWTLSVPGRGNAPQPRDFHSAVYDPTSNKMIIFGGHLTPSVGSGGDQSDNHVYALDDANNLESLSRRLTPNGGADR